MKLRTERRKSSKSPTSERASSLEASLRSLGESNNLFKRSMFTMFRVDMYTCLSISGHFLTTRTSPLRYLGLLVMLAKVSFDQIACHFCWSAAQYAKCAINNELRLIPRFPLSTTQSHSRPDPRQALLLHREPIFSFPNKQTHRWSRLRNLTPEVDLQVNSDAPLSGSIWDPLRISWGDELALAYWEIQYIRPDNERHTFTVLHKHPSSKHLLLPLVLRFDYSALHYH